MIGQKRGRVLTNIYILTYAKVESVLFVNFERLVVNVENLSL